MTKTIATRAKQGFAGIVVAAGFLSLASSASAHHSYAMFDRQKNAEISGTVRTMQWTNPHTYLWVYASNKKGGQDVWGFEFGGGPNGLIRAGWTKKTLNVGDKITVKYHPLRDGRTGGEFLSVVLPNGKIYDSRGEVPKGGRPVRGSSGGPAVVGTEVQ